MRLPHGPGWSWFIRLSIPALIVSVWWLSAGSDAEWSLWRRYSAPAALLNVACSALLLAAGYVLVSPAAARVRLPQVILLAGSAMVTLALLEIPTLAGHDYGRTLGTRQNDTWLQLAMGVNRQDPDLIHVHQPHTRYRGTVQGNLVRLGIPMPASYDVDVAYDRHGFRNDEDFTQADVVAIGDSFVEGAETPRSQTAVAAISRRLNTRVANLGQSNYGPQQELVVLERYALPLAPKVVVWFFFGGNDLSDVDVYEWRRAHLDDFLAPPSLGSRSFARNVLTALAQLTTPVRRMASPAARRHAARFVRADGTVEVQYLDAPEEPWLPRQWETAAGALERARDAAQSVGADFLIVYIPRKLRVYRDYIEVGPESVVHAWPMNDLPDVMAQWCLHEGIDFLDATPPLRDAVAAGTSVYLPDDVHWNAEGHRIVAEAVSRRIQTLGSLAGQPPRVSR